MPKISTEQIQTLRQSTGVGLMDAKKALEEAEGDLVKAQELLRKRGEKVTASKANRVTEQGIVESYIHANQKVGSVVVLLCETDFVARTPEFQELAHELAIQVAATGACYVSPDEVPAEIVEKEKEVIRAQVDSSKKPAIQESIIKGKLDKFFAEICLLKQQYVKDDSMTIEEMMTSRVTKLGENIRIKEIGYFAI
ncbi:MAG: elongation factor Ts [bacterium]|nr:elongation factor Ts [bacterium]